MKNKQIKGVKNVFFKKRQIKKTKWQLILFPEIIWVVALVLFLSAASMFFVNHKYYEVDQFSMQPLLNNYQTNSVRDGVFVLLDAKIEVGDVLVLNYNNTTVVKRLIATGGDKIAIARIQEPISARYAVKRIAKGTTTPYEIIEPYVSASANMQTVFLNFENYLEQTNKKQIIGDETYLVLEEDEIFYLGDNRGKSYDSSNYGPGKIEDVIGKVKIIVFKQQNMLFHIFQYLFGFKKV